MKTASKSNPEINEPIALFEFGTEPGIKTPQTGTRSNNNNSRFEMTRSQVAEMIDTLDGIQKKIDELSY